MSPVDMTPEVRAFLLALAERALHDAQSRMSREYFSPDARAHLNLTRDAVRALRPSDIDSWDSVLP